MPEPDRTLGCPPRVVVGHIVAAANVWFVTALGHALQHDEQRFLAGKMAKPPGFAADHAALLDNLVEARKVEQSLWPFVRQSEEKLRQLGLGTHRSNARPHAG